MDVHIQYAEPNEEIDKKKKKKEQKNPTNSMTSFKGFGRARTSYQKTVIREFFKKNKKQKADGQDGIQQ